MRQQWTALQLFRSPLTNWPLIVVCTTLIAIALSGCSAQIGDACEHRDDCPSGAVCDRSVEDGFCTIADCRPGDCPSESICVEYERHDAYCMRSCEDSDDCRRDHVCIDDSELELRYCFVEE